MCVYIYILYIIYVIYYIYTHILRISSLIILSCYVHCTPGTQKHLGKVPFWKKVPLSIHRENCYVGGRILFGGRRPVSGTHVRCMLRSHVGFSKFLARKLLRCRCARSCGHLGTAGNFMKLLDRYCSKLRPFVPFGLHIQMICPLLATRTDYCSSVDRSLNVPEIFKAALWNGQWLEADLAEACAWVRGSKLAPWWKFVFPTGLPPIWSHDIFADLIAALRSSMYPGEIRRILRTGVEILPGRKKILLNVLGG